MEIVVCLDRFNQIQLWHREVCNFSIVQDCFRVRGGGFTHVSYVMVVRPLATRPWEDKEGSEEWVLQQYRTRLPRYSLLFHPCAFAPLSHFPWEHIIFVLIYEFSTWKHFADIYIYYLVYPPSLVHKSTHLPQRTDLRKPLWYRYQQRFLLWSPGELEKKKNTCRRHFVALRV